MFKRLKKFGLLALITAASISQQVWSQSEASPPIQVSGKSWIVGFDNDILVPGGRDQDYTYGIRLTRVGAQAKNHLLSTHTPLNALDRLFRIENPFNGGFENSSIEYGLFGFTPEDTSISGVNPDDRPYASLVYTSSSRARINLDQDQAWHSSLTVGFLGLDIVGDLQEGLHRGLDNQVPEGWDNQISAGGEPTFRYNVAKQTLLANLFDRFELKQTQQASLGYLTEASWSLGLRAGKIRSPWVAFNPEQSFYGEHATNKFTSKFNEQFFWAGVTVRARLYNAFLQGQFRNSELTYNFSELNHFITEAWVGYTLTLKEGLQL